MKNNFRLQEIIFRFSVVLWWKYRWTKKWNWSLTVWGFCFPTENQEFQSNFRFFDHQRKRSVRCGRPHDITEGIRVHVKMAIIGQREGFWEQRKVNCDIVNMRAHIHGHAHICMCLYPKNLRVSDKRVWTINEFGNRLWKANKEQWSKLGLGGKWPGYTNLIHDTKCFEKKEKKIIIQNKTRKERAEGKPSYSLLDLSWSLLSIRSSILAAIHLFIPNKKKKSFYLYR